MELVGDEKRIQALFSELSSQDQSAAPRFESVWRAAERRERAQVRTFAKARLVLASVLLVVAAASFAAWLWHRSKESNPERANNITPPSTPAPSQQLVRQTNHTTAPVAAVNPRPRIHKHLARSRRSDPALSEAKVFARWQSPTQLLMKSPAAVDLNSVPQLNQSVEELKQFLPRNTSGNKESNQ